MTQCQHIRNSKRSSRLPSCTLLLVVLVIIFLSFGYLSAQTPPRPLDFFPHHQGDVFEYQNNGVSTWFQNIIIKDSLAGDGKYYLETTYFGKMTVDTALREVRNNEWGGGYYSTLLFKLDADSGDTWICWRNQFGAIRATVFSVFPSSGFGVDVVIKEIGYTDSASGLYLQSYRLASKFGIVAEYEDLGLDYYLRGARIDGDTYGTVASVHNTDLGRQPMQFVLYQNYPNPFNSSTTITFELPKSSVVKLSVYDMLGREVSVLVNDRVDAGVHEVRFDASGNSSGVYFYRLQAGDFVQTRRLLFLR